MGTLASFIERAADILAPVDGVHRKSLLGASWMATDGAGLKVLIPDPERPRTTATSSRTDGTTSPSFSMPDKAGENLLAKLRRRLPRSGRPRLPLR